MGERRFPCAQCGARLEYVPGTAALRCPYCAHENPIPDPGTLVEELDYHEQLAALCADEPLFETLVIKCTACAAEVTAPENVTAVSCPFCGSSIVATAKSRKAIRPRALLPFLIRRDEARAKFRAWLNKLWFAPSDVKKFTRLDAPLHGVYTPCWTYDFSATTPYSGQRGDDYWTTEMRTVMVNGKATMRPMQVKRTRWRHVAGVVQNEFDDLLVLASHSLPRKQADELAPWDLHQLVPYADEYLSGFSAESYQVGLDEGFEAARSAADAMIVATIRANIGGDHQRIRVYNPQISGVTFKHILLPVWVSAYRRGRRVYRFVVNARTGEVQGERPYSAWKITGAVLAGLLLIATIVAVVAYFQS